MHTVLEAAVGGDPELGEVLLEEGEVLPHLGGGAGQRGDGLLHPGQGGEHVLRVLREGVLTMTVTATGTGTVTVTVTVTGRQGDRETGRQGDRETGRQGQ